MGAYELVSSTAAELARVASDLSVEVGGPADPGAALPAARSLAELAEGGPNHDVLAKIDRVLALFTD